MAYATLRNWSFVNRYDIYTPCTPPEYLPMMLRGEVYNHPKKADGTSIITTSVVDAKKEEGGVMVYTKNTVYFITAEDINPEYEAGYPDAYNRFRDSIYDN